MAAVFISYASQDREKARRLVAALEAGNLTVWWDRKIGMGANYDREIEHELHAAKCVVVLWSKHAVESDWVRDEAQYALDRGLLVPASLDGTSPPLGFGRKQTADLSTDAGLDGLLAAVSEMTEQRLEPAVEKRARGRKSGMWRKLLAAAGAIVLAVLVAWLTLVPRSSDHEVLPGSPRADEDAIAVLPFIDMTRAQQSEYLGSGIADELIYRFSELPGVRVPSLTSVRSLQRQGKDARKIGLATEVGSLLEGSIRGEAGALVIAARLVDVEADRTLWQGRFPITGEESLRAQQQIAQEVLAALYPDADESMLAHVANMGTENAAAYREYLLGLHLMRPVNSDAYRAALDRFDGALLMDGEFRSAKLYKALVISLLSNLYEQRERDTEADSLLQELSGEKLPPWAQMRLEEAEDRLHGGTLFVGQAERARQGMEDARVPSVWHLTWFGWALAKSGMYELSAAYLEQALAQDPVNVDVNRKLGQVYAVMGRVEEATQTLSRCVDLVREIGVCSYSLLWLMAAGGASEDEIDAVLSKLPNLAGERSEFWTAVLHATAGRIDESKAALDGSSFQVYFFGYGHFLFWWGEDEAAFDHFRETLANSSIPDFFLIRQFAWPPDRLTQIRSHPRYMEHVARLGITPKWQAELCAQAETLTAITSIEVDCRPYRARAGSVTM
jgi:TolB-like protein